MTGAAVQLRDQVRSEIVRVGWSETSRLAGVDRTVLHRAFPASGPRMPSLPVLDRVTAALGLSLSIEKV